MKKSLLLLPLGAFLFFGGISSFAQEDPVANAAVYLKSQGNEPTATMALVAAGESVDVSYLKSFSGTSAISYAKPIMAIAAAGEDPRTFAGENLVAKLKSFADETQLGSADQINDDIWGILALTAAGDDATENSKNFILANQNDDGGWAWNVGGTSDTNDTSVAIMALLETGMLKSDTAIQNALAYLQTAQNDDGGFPYDPVSPFGTDSDANSDAWVIMAFNKLGEDASDAVQHLLSLQDEDGGFWWMAPPTDFNNKAATADAVIALTGNSFPVLQSYGKAFFKIVGSVGEICRGAVTAATAMDVVINASEECGYTYDIQDTSFGSYLAAINDDVAEGLNGWMYTVDGELPSIGAADYALSGGESVLWFFGEFGDDPPVLGEVSEAVDLSVQIVQGGRGGGGGTSPEVGFSVTPGSLDFGQLAPGNSVAEQVTLKNEGQKNLNIEVEVLGDSVFNFLKLNDILWNLFSLLLPTGTAEEVGVRLAIPAEFQSFGQKQGSLIFWGTATD
jgi:hypothetical protein